MPCLEKFFLLNDLEIFPVLKTTKTVLTPQSLWSWCYAFCFGNEITGIEIICMETVLAVWKLAPDEVMTTIISSLFKVRHI